MPTAMRFAVHRSPLHHWHLAHGAHFAEIDGWQVPVSYADPRQEVEAARNGLALADISHLPKLSLRGPGVSAVAAALGNVVPRRVEANNGVLVCRLAEQCLFLLAYSTSKADLSERVQPSADIVSTDITSAYAGFALMGKDAETLVGRLTGFDVSKRQFPEGACAETELAGVHALLVRPPVRAVPELSAYVPWDVGEYLWEILLDLGRNLGGAPVGHDALKALRTAP